MKSFVISNLINLVIIAAVYLDHFKGIEYAGNLAIFAIWILIVLGFIAVFLPSKELYKNHTKLNYFNRVTQVALLLELIALGWTFTAVGYFSCLLFLWGKRAIYKEEQEKEAAQSAV